MTFERPASPAPVEPGPPAASASAGPVAPDAVTAAMRLQILSTEHWSLLASRSLAWNEVFARAGTYLSALSGAIIALALTGQGGGYGDTFLLFGIVILPVVLFIGVGTWLRMGASNYHDAQCVLGMNRIRGAYLELAPELGKYFVISAHDDVRGIGVTMAVEPGTSQVVHMIAATPFVVIVLNAVVAGAIAALVVEYLHAAHAIALVGALVAFALVLLVQFGYARGRVTRGQMSVQSLFPSE
jgi:hypothetical protein